MNFQNLQFPKALQKVLLLLCLIAVANKIGFDVQRGCSLQASCAVGETDVVQFALRSLSSLGWAACMGTDAWSIPVEAVMFDISVTSCCLFHKLHSAMLLLVLQTLIGDVILVF